MMQQSASDRAEVAAERARMPVGADDDDGRLSRGLQQRVRRTQPLGTGVHAHLRMLLPRPVRAESGHGLLGRILPHLASLGRDLSPEAVTVCAE